MIGLAVGCIGAFIYLYSQIFFEYITRVQQNKFVDYDVRTITAADYSIEFNLRDSQYNHWKKHYIQEENPMSELAQFKVYIQDILEDRVNQMSDLGFEESKNGDEER